MKYLEKYESFDELDFILDLKDILVDLEDLDFYVEYSKTNSNINILIRKNNPDNFFYMDENLKYFLTRIANYLNKDLTGYWTSGSTGVKFYVYRDSRGIRTNTSRGNSKMDEKWPRIYRLVISQISDIKS